MCTCNPVEGAVYLHTKLDMAVCFVLASMVYLLCPWLTYKCSSGPLKVPIWSAGVHHCHFVLNLYITLTLCVSFSSIRSGELVVMHLFSICLSRKTSCWMKSSGNKYICSRESTDVNRKLMTAEFLLTAAVSESCYCQACLIATL